MAQSAIHNSLPLIEEIVTLLEKEEELEITKEVERRRMRLGSGRPEDIRNEVGRDIWGASKVRRTIHDHLLASSSKPAWLFYNPFFNVAAFYVRRDYQPPRHLG